MRIHADASVKRQLVTALRATGLEVTSQYEIDPTLDDSKVLSIANNLEAILLTEDKDFGELVFRQGLYARGVILVRADVANADAVAGVTASIAGALGQAEGAFSTITLSEVRRRPIERP